VITLDKVDEIRKEIERDFEELIRESKTCLLCFAAKLRGLPFCVFHIESFMYKLRAKSIKDHDESTRALIRVQDEDKKLNELISYILEEPRFLYLFTSKGNRIKAWRFRASYERVKKKDYPKVDS